MGRGSSIRAMRQRVLAIRAAKEARAAEAAPHSSTVGSTAMHTAFGATETASSAVSTSHDRATSSRGGPGEGEATLDEEEFDAIPDSVTQRKVNEYLQSLRDN